MLRDTTQFFTFVSIMSVCAQDISLRYLSEQSQHVNYLLISTGYVGYVCTIL